MTPHRRASDGYTHVGRDIRLIAGCLVILANVLLIYLDIHEHETVTTQDIIMHGMIFLTGFAMVDPRRGGEIVGNILRRKP